MDYAIRTIPHEDQRYNSPGDYRFREYGVVLFECTDITVSDLGNEDYSFLVALHEFIEEHLTRKRGIPENVIYQWDIDHSESDDPGSIDGCPYFAEHAFAMYIEKQVCSKLGIDWNEYDASFSKLIWRNK